MCTAVNFNGRVIDTVGGLREVSPAIVKHPAYEAIPKDSACLCGVDVKAVLDGVGLKYEYDRAFDEYTIGTGD